LALLDERKELEKKEDQKTRPIVAYQLVNKDGRTVNVSVVHTGPSGKEFARKKVYAQVSTHLAWVNTKIGGGEPDSQSWVVLGDFYLTSEADITAEDDKATKSKQKILRPRDQKDTFGALFPGEISVPAEDGGSWES
jgi:endonuclease/exonuclease/phosphatase family metal-dependent hydrolase